MEMRRMFAPAKVNLFLEVLERRADGYHAIRSVMQSLDLGDTITVWAARGARKNEIALRCSDASLPCDARNLAYRAAVRYLEAAGISDAAVEIEVEKRIPIAAGLAGGSADAAAVLLLLNQAFGRTMDRDALCRLGAGLGADVPFCICAAENGGAMLAAGIGEVLTAAAGLPESAWVLLAAFDFPVSTAWAYAELDRVRGGAAVRTERAETLYNAFEDAVIPHYPVIGEVKRGMLDGGARGALMSGSGATVFGVFEEEAAARAAAGRLARIYGVRTFLCRPYAPGR